MKFIITLCIVLISCIGNMLSSAQLNEKKDKERLKKYHEVLSKKCGIPIPLGYKCCVISNSDPHVHASPECIPPSQEIK